VSKKEGKMGRLVIVTVVMLVVLVGLLPATGVSAASRLVVDDDRVQFRNADYTTISAAVAAASSGDTIVVYPGTYNESVVLDGSGLTVKSAKGAAATVVNPQGGYGFAIEASSVTVQGFTVMGADIGISAYPATYWVGDIAILDNILDGNGLGIYMWAENFRIARNAIRNCGWAMDLEGSDGIIDRNVLSNSGEIDLWGMNLVLEGNSLQGVSIYTEGAFNPEIRNNVIDGGNMYLSGVVAARVVGNTLRKSPGRSGVVTARIVGNTLRNSPGTAIWVNEANLTIEGNQIVNPGEWGINWGVIGTMVVRHNRISGASFGIVTGAVGEISGNVISDAVVGVFHYESGLQLLNNTIKNVTVGVVLSGDTDRVVGNAIKDAAIGVLVSIYADASEVAGNTFKDTSLKDVWREATDGPPPITIPYP
jgi:hypothetical protein